MRENCKMMEAIEKLFEYFEKDIPLSEFDKKTIQELYHIEELDKGDVLFRQGEMCRSEAFVISGTLRSYYVDGKGQEHVLNFALPGWWVGDLASFYQKTPALHSVEALEDTVLLVINPENKEILFKKIPALERFFRIIIQKHLSSLQKRFLVTISENAEIRYLNLINRIPAIEQLVPQYQIASYLGILPESLSRLKRKLLEKK